MKYKELLAEKQRLAASQQNLIDMRANGTAWTEEQKNDFSASKERLSEVGDLMNEIQDLNAMNASDDTGTFGMKTINAIGDEEDKAPTAAHNTSREIQTIPNARNVSMVESSVNGAFSSMADQLKAVRNAGLNRGVDQRLVQMGAITGHGESVDADGGFLLQPDFADPLIGQIIETGQLSRLCTRMPVVGNSIKIPYAKETSRATGSRNGGIQGYWKGEGAAPTASTTTLAQLEVKLNKLVALCYATDEMLEDVSFITAWLDTMVTSELGFLLDEAILRGTGVASPLGVLNSNALVTVAKESGQATGSVVVKNVRKMYSRVRPRSLARSVWLSNQDVMPAIMGLEDGNGNGLFLPGGTIANAPFGALLGRPIVPIEQASTVGTVGDLVLADLSDYLLIDKGGVPEMAASIHVKFIEGEQAFRWTLRVGGAPLTANALTPNKGANTISPYVTLATRT